MHKVFSGERARASEPAARLLALAMAIALFAALMAGCGSPPGGAVDSGGDPVDSGGAPADSGGAPAAGGQTIDLKLWGSQDEQPLLQSMSDSFKAAHPENTYNITLGVVSEADAQAKYSEDPAAAADVFMLANDQLRALASSGSLYEVTRNKDAIVSRNLPGSIEAASYNDALYAYPMTADNGYFLYYDKSVVSEEQAGSVETLLEAASAADRKVMMDVSNGWYIASFFIGAGCTLGIDENGNQLCDYNNANGLAAAEAIKAFTAHPAFMTGDDTILSSGIGTMICAGVSGTWNASNIMSALGENYAAAKLPTYAVDGTTYQMGSFGGYKLVGVNSLTKFPEAAMDMADWLTNEQNQMERFTARAFGPSNVAAADSDEVKADVALSALASQNEFAIPQNDVTNAFWGPTEAFGTTMEAKDYSLSLQELLDAMVVQITAGS